MKTHLKIAMLFPAMLLKHRHFTRKHGMKSLWRSLRLNLRQFPLADALRLPIYVSSNYRLKSLDGKMILNAPIEPGIVKFGTYEIGTYNGATDTGIIDLKPDSTITFDGKALFGVGCRISVNASGHLRFGEDFVVTAASTFICSNLISFGKSCLLSWEILLMDTDLHTILPVSTKKEEIHIGDRNWIGCRCTLLKSTETGANCIIGANSQLRKAYHEDNVLIAGNPAAIVRREVNWK